MQSRNRDKVRIYHFPAQSRNRGQSKNICVIIIIIVIIFILFVNSMIDVCPLIEN